VTAKADRELAAHRLAVRLDRPITWLGVFALGLWLVEPFISERHVLSTIVDFVWGAVALAFVIEFLARVTAAEGKLQFIREHWWELGLVALPFLRFLRVARAARAARGMAAAVRSSHRAGQQLQSRLTWLLVITAVVSVSSARLLVDYGGYKRSYADAMHDAALSTLTGTALGLTHPFAQVLEIVLAVYSAVIIATVAGTVGAFFLAQRPAPEAAEGASGSV
jgi:voltage-gated potassium channel